MVDHAPVTNGTEGVEKNDWNLPLCTRTKEMLANVRGWKSIFSGVKAWM